MTGPSVVPRALKEFFVLETHPEARDSAVDKSVSGPGEDAQVVQRPDSSSQP
ncbi:MAG: hypothetical protein WAV54_01990 [Acidimicrobiales bacterium]